MLRMVTGNAIKTKASMLGCCWSREAGPLTASLIPCWVCLYRRDVKTSWFIMNLRNDYLTCSCLESNTGCVNWNGDRMCAFVYVLKRAAGMLVFLVLCCISALWRMYEYLYMCRCVCACVFQSLPADFCMALQISASQHHPPSLQQQREWEIDAKKKHESLKQPIVKVIIVNKNYCKSEKEH